ncbi:MAG: peroxide stress protein YaaA [Actinomycetota bacterium]|nr:MAG: peroxide stress protein YaaA [Actinomycetota bacterium]
MLVLLPPSEGKRPPDRGHPLQLDTLSFPDLTVTRERVLDALVRLCRNDAGQAARVLGLSAGLADEVRRNVRLAAAPTATAARIYTGVLYEALDVASLDAAARRRAHRWIAVCSGLWGLLRLTDRIPAYRLAGGVVLPGLGSVTAAWRPALAQALPRAAGNGIVLDLRSTSYAAAWRPDAATAGRTVVARVLAEQPDGRRTIVSHSNKATKGRLVRALLTSGRTPATPAALAAACSDAGYDVTLTAPGRPAAAWTMDVVVRD